LRRFNLRRVEDETGISGVGIVTEGVQFTDGSCAMRWVTETSSVCFYKSIEDVISIHGHGGKTQVEWQDNE
jgi:hypothetical protein